MRSRRNSLFSTGFGITVGYLLTLAFILASAIVSYAQYDRVYLSGDRVIRTWQLISRLEQVYGYAHEAESTQRGFLLTGDAAQLTEYQNARRHLAGSLQGVEDLVGRDPAQSSRLSLVRIAVSAKTDEMESLIRTRQTRGLTRASELVSSGSGIEEMRQIRAQIDQMENVERTIVQEESERRRHSSQQATAAFLAGVLVSVAVVTVLHGYARRYVRDQESLRLGEIEHRRALEMEIGRRDIAEARERQVMAELERSNRELQDFAFVASHDLQEPLRKIQAFGDRLRRKAGDGLDASSLEYLDRMDAAAKRMQQLIEAILNLSRVTSRAQPFVPVDLNRTLALVKDDLSTRLEETQGSLVLEPLPMVQADPVQMGQLFQNLVGNALKFRKADTPPVVRVTCAREGARVVVRVSDNGIGFEPRYADRIFTVFQRLHGRGEYEGSGVGLAICRRIVERHGGHIAAESEPGQGTTFTFDLPLTGTPTT